MLKARKNIIKKKQKKRLKSTYIGGRLNAVGQVIYLLTQEEQS